METQIRAEHALHRRRLSRNIGLGVTLIVFVALVYSLTVVKVSHLGDPVPAAATSSQ